MWSAGVAVTLDLASRAKGQGVDVRCLLACSGPPVHQQVSPLFLHSGLSGSGVFFLLQVALRGLEVILLYYEWDWCWNGEEILQHWQGWNVRWAKSHRFAS